MDTLIIYHASNLFMNLITLNNPIFNVWLGALVHSTQNNGDTIKNEINNYLLWASTRFYKDIKKIQE